MKAITENLAVAVLFLVISGCSYQNTRREESKQQQFSGAYAPEDADFLANTADIYLKGIKLGEVALKYTSEPSIISLATVVRSERKESMKELKNIAAQRLILIPTNVSFDDERIIMNLSEKKGRDFDEAFCMQVEANHRQIISNVEQTLNNLKDKEIREWAINSLPHLKSQLLLATECRKEIMNKKIHN